MSEVKVSKITIEIEGKGIIELTVEEAQKMKMCLDEIFKKPENIKEYIPISVPEINPAEGGIEVRGAYKPKPTEIGKRPAPTPYSPPKKKVNSRS